MESFHVAFAVSTLWLKSSAWLPCELPVSMPVSEYTVSMPVREPSVSECPVKMPVSAQGKCSTFYFQPDLSLELKAYISIS